LSSSPQGHLFDKECIYEALLHQKKVIKRQRQLWKEQMMKLKEEEMAKERAKYMATVNMFEKTESSLLPPSSSSSLSTESPSSSKQETGSIFTSTLSSSKQTTTTATTATTTKLSPDSPPPRPAELAQNTEERTTQLSSYWVPALTPSAPPTPLSKPKKTTYCLEGNHPLTLKDLIPVNFTLVPKNNSSSEKNNNYSWRSLREGDDNISNTNPSESDGNNNNNNTSNSNEDVLHVEYMCPLCTKTLNNAIKAVLLRGCGHVLCLHCTQQFVVPSKTCPVCNEPCSSESDRIQLQTGGTGYAAHDRERLQAVLKTPAPWI
jgi:nitric oxide synthase-interacting protein